MNCLLSAKVFTIFPEMFPGPLETSLVGRALNKGTWNLEAINLRDYATDKHRSVDDTSFGGGPGMVLRPDIIDAALQDHYNVRPNTLIYLSPRGIPLTQEYVKKLAKQSHLGLLCGRFEGVDQRVLDAWHIEEVSLGDFILSGGEIAAMAILDAVVRLLPGVLGEQESLNEESFNENLLEYPQYTRPQNWKNYAVPEVLLSGHHEKIKAWRKAESEKLTRERRADLWQRYKAAQQERKD
ncbi:MAG: tRNA (guanosine(37)-N1)-methyltransferase TrmD [Caedibacter sp. 37-49]|nr:MAG: tRNA (guanosine(37)-N1)-methyltransferase TrmD [Caedibacter sp. 37-49]